MALLHSLEICGVRSFSPENREAISFNTPVTLFLGHNGCGKTTIIECIRFALTSELPSGSSNGQGFLNDPKMSHKNQVKASIKIKFLDSQGNLIIVSRFMSVTTKPGGGLTFKNLMPNIRKREKNNEGTPEDISGRCIDIDSYCCSALNVSKSILNNVLFCHQENSSWPLDEPKKLKEKFDEIFDAVKYNKCVDDIRKLIKEQQSNLKNLKDNLGYKKSIKDEVDRQKGKLNTKKREFSSIDNQIMKMKADVEPLEKKILEILELEENLDSLQRALQVKQTERKGLIDQQSTLKKSITYIFDGTDDELNSKINSFQSEQISGKNAIFEFEKNKNEVCKSIADINIKIQTIQVKIGQLKEEKKQYTKKVDEFKELSETLRVRLEMNEVPQNSDKIYIIKSFKNALTSADTEYKALEKQNDLKERELQSKIDNMREECAAKKQQLTSKKKLLIEVKNKIKDIRDKLDDLDSSNSQLKIVGKAIEDNKSTLKKLKNSFNESQKIQEIEEIKEEIAKKEAFLEKLDKEYRILQQNFAKEQQLESERNELLDKRREVHKIKKKHSENFKILFDEQIPEINLKKSVMEIQNKEEIKAKNILQKINALEKEITTLETTIKHNNRKLENDKKDLALKKKKVSEICKGRSFNEVLQETELKKQKYQRDKGQFSSGKIMYEAFIEKFEKDSPCCPICETDFKNKNTIVQAIIRKLKRKIETIPIQLQQVEVNLKKEEVFYNSLQQLQPVNDDIENLLNTQIPRLEAEIDKLNEKYEEKQMMLVSEKVSLEQPQKLIEITKAVLTDAALLDQFNSDIRKANATIAQLEQNIIKVFSNRSRQETEAEIDTTKAELSNLKNRLESNKKMLDLHRERCLQINASIQNETQRQIDIQKLVQEKPLLEKQFSECQEEISSLTKDIDELVVNLDEQEKELANLLNEKLEMVHNNRDILEKERKRISQLSNIFNEIQKLQQHIEKYLKNDMEQKLDVAVEELARLKIDMDKMEHTKSNIVDAIMEKKEMLANKETQFRALRDNITLREKQKAELALTNDISKLEKNIGGYNYVSVRKQKREIEQNIDKYTKQISTLEGKKEEIENQINDLETDLEKPQNRNALNIYKKQAYAVKLEEFIIKDLGEYIRVLEQSVLKFHQERMLQINKTIRELWRSIYRGNDIDFIEIKTDEHTITGANRRRTYNYKVVQVKNNVELEMRGRCSAGQKVLACLVIRMALAETFSANCGILALDEPTTNLDRENIQSLSDSLSRIISDRENQRNFQLLIITHDEDFLNSLTRMQSLDNYWKVKRNQSGFSIVEKKYL